MKIFKYMLNLFNKPTVVVVDDDSITINLLRKILQNNRLYKFKFFSESRLAYDYIVTKKPDIVICDLMIPEMSGDQLCLVAKNVNDKCKCILYSSAWIDFDKYKKHFKVDLFYNKADKNINDILKEIQSYA